MNLTANEQFALITDVQNVPTTVTRLEDGSEYVTYGVTPASEAAGAKLLAAFWPAIIGAARSSHLTGPDAREEAESVAMEAFVRAVREFDLTADTPFHHVVSRLMRFAVLRNDREESSNSLTIPAVQVARYHRAMNAHGEDAEAAAADCARDASRWLLTERLFLTVHYALTTSESFDLSAAGDYLGGQVQSAEDEILNREYARQLLGELRTDAERIVADADAVSRYASDAATAAESKCAEWSEWLSVVEGERAELLSVSPNDRDAVRAADRAVKDAKREANRAARLARAARHAADWAAKQRQDVDDAPRVAAVRESICRLAYGFKDTETEAIRAREGYRVGERLEDLQIAPCVGLARSTVQRERGKALKTMREAAEKAIAAE